VTTDLQRRLILGADARSSAVVFINGAALFTSAATLDVRGLSLADLRKTLAEYGPGRDAAIHFALCLPPPEPQPQSPDAVRLLRWALEGLGRDAGFGRATSYMTSFNRPYDWASDVTGPFRDSLAGGVADEPNVGDERVGVYPVRMPLSRVLLQGRPDCVIDVRVPLDARQELRLPADADKSLHAAVARLKLPAGAKADFRFDVRERDDDGPNRVRRFAERLAAELGLQSLSFSH
jgi:hypothetical protein